MRKVLSVWKAILIVLASFVGVGGLTALGVYLTGGFNEVIVNPADIYFSQEVSGEGSYNTTTEQYEISDNVNIKILSSTKDVTKKEVTLMFTDEDGRRADQQLVDGYLTNGIIKVPQNVEIGKNIQIQLEREDGAIVGGKSYIMAKSENVEIDSIRTTIAVDVPTDELQLEVQNSSEIDGVYHVVVDTQFQVFANFAPTSSKYMYGDTTRAKGVFFAVTGSGLNYDEEENIFHAQNVTSGTDYTRIVAYAFRKAYYEEKFFAEHTNPTTNEIVAYLSSHETESVLKTINVQVISVDVDNVSFSIDKSNVKLLVDKETTITTNGVGDRSLGAVVKNSQDLPLTSLLGQVGIKLPTGIDGLSIRGGNVVKVTAAGINIVGANEIVVEEGTDYYILPDTNATSARNYHWTFETTETFASTKMKLNFFYEKNGGWVKFFDDEEEQYFNLLAEQHLDGAVGWKNTEIINLLISFDQDGRTITSSVNLSSLINNVPEDNVYKTIKYFLLVDDASVVADLQTIFDCKAAVEYSEDEISLVGVSQRDSYALYEVNGDILTALKSIRGVIKVVPVIVKTNSQGAPYKDGSKYLIASAGSAKEIIVDSTLSINKMSVAYHFNEDEIERTEGGVTTGSIFELNGDYYLPSVRKDENGQDITLLYFDLELESDDVEGDADKVLNAQRDAEQLLKVVCININGTESNVDYVYLDDLQIRETTEDKIFFIGSLAINSDVFNLTNASNGIYVKLELRYTDKQRDEVYSKSIKQQETEKDGFYIYYQKPENLIGAYEETREIEDPINVGISIANGVQITWTTDDVLDTSALMNDLLNFTILDQKGKLIRISDRMYNIKFVEEEPNGAGWKPKESDRAISFNSNGTAIMNFIPNGADVVTTYASIYVIDNEENKVYGTTEETQTRFTFQITGEGLASVRYDKSKECGVQDLDEAASMSEIFIEKNVEADSVIILSDLFEIETSAGIVDKEVNPYTISLDSTFVSTFGAEASRDMMKMMAFKLFGADESGDDEGYDTEAGRTLAKYLGEDIAALKVFAPFNSRTSVIFNITDANSLYVVKLHVTFLTNIDTQSNFETLVAPYSRYLSTSATNPTAINVVAGSTYSLDDAMPFTDVHYQWSRNAVGFESSNADVINMPTPGTIKIENVYHNVLVKIYVYFGVESQYAYSLELNFYVHPNIIMLERNTFVDISDYGDLSDYYWLIEMKAFVDSGTVREVSLSEDFEYVNSTLGPRYISLNSVGVFNLEEATLNYQFGTQYSQEFQIKHNDEEQIRNLDFALVHANGDVETFEADHAKFTFEIGYGSDAEEQMVQAIVSGAKVVTYRGEPTLLLVAGKEYSLVNYTIYSFVKVNTVFNTGVTNAIVIPDDFGSYFVDDEALGLTTKVGRLTINVVLKAIVSKVGDIFVYYDPETIEGKDFSYLLSSGGTLANYEIYQKVFAGRTYDVLTNSATEEVFVKVANTELNFDIDGEIKHYTFNADSQTFEEIVLYVKTGTSPDVYELATQAAETYYYLSGTVYIVVDGDIYEKMPVPGFYYDGDVLGRTSSISLSVESQEIEGLARIVDNQLVLSDLTADENGKYVVLKLQVSSISQPDNKFVWYYRFRVYSNFDKGEVFYPYQNQAEYLDQFSEYYDKNEKTYTIRLDDAHGEAAQNIGKKRFEDDDVDFTTSAYSITSVKINGVETANYSAYIEISISAENVLTMHVNSTETKIDVKLTKTYTREGVEMLGADLVYLFKINQSSTYSPVVKLYRKERQYNSGVIYYVYDDDTESYITPVTQPTSATFGNDTYYSFVTLDSATQTDRTYTASMSAGDKPVEFNTQLYKYSNGTSTRVGANDYHVALVGNENGKYVSPDFEFENEKLIIHPNEDIEINGTFTIVFYTEEKVAFKIVVNAKSYFEFEQKQTSISAGRVEDFDYFIDVINTKDETAEVIHHIQTKTEEEAKYVEIDNENETIAFAYLLNNMDITFVDTIKETPDGEDKFTFEFTIRVNAQSPFVQNNLTSTAHRFGQVAFDVEINDLASILRDAENTKFVGGVSDTAVRIVPIDVGVGNEYEYTTFQQILTLQYLFKEGADPIVGSVVYFYRVYPNVEFTIHYPDPDGEGTNNQEFVTNDTTTSYTLAGTAEFATGARVATDFVAEVKALPSEVQAGIVKRISVEISDISLVILKYSGASLDGVGTTGILAGFDFNTAFTLELVEGAAGDGYIVFTVKCNEVTQEYRIDVITAEDTVSIKSNAPNYTNNHEVVYVEDLSTYEDLDLFATGRVLNMTFSNSASLETTYYIRLKEKNGNRIKVVAAKADKRNPNSVNVDMGQAFIDYEYIATYSTAELAQSGDVGAIANLYVVEPNITNRLMFKYYNGLIIRGATSEVTRSDDHSEFTGLTSSDYNNRTNNEINEVNLDVAMKYNDEVIRENIGTYILQPAVEFDVKGNADTFNSADDPAPYAIINANPSADLSLLEYFTVFRITNTRTNQLYTPTSMANSKGSLSVQIYGFEECKIESANVWAFHENIDITPRANGYTIDESGWDPDFSDHTITYNYITLSGKKVENDKGVKIENADWLIRAQGARNEGDFVMLKISYTVSFGNGDHITVSHNALIKVDPNSRVTINGNRADEQGEIVGTGEGSAWASNKDDPIPVTNNPTIYQNAAETGTFNINTRTIAPRTDFGENADSTDLIVWLYGNSGAGGNNASSERLTYSMTQNATIDGLQYNNFLIENMKGTGQEYKGIDEGLPEGITIKTLNYYKGSADVVLFMPELTLGERYYCVEARDNFNFQVKIYYKLVGDLNPQVTLSSATLTEGTPLVFAASYSPMGATTMNITNVLDTNKNEIKVQVFDRYVDTSDGNKIKSLTCSQMAVETEWDSSHKWTISGNPSLYFIFEGVPYTIDDQPATGQVIGATKYNSSDNKYNNTKWYNAAGDEVTFTQNASYTYKLGINVKDENLNTSGEYKFRGSVKYNEIEVLPNYSSAAENESIGIEAVRAADTTNLKNAELATLTGIYSYGFTTNPSKENYLGIATSAGIGETFKSYIGNIRVTSIQLIKDDISARSAASQIETFANGKKLAASSDYRFVNKLTGAGETYEPGNVTKSNNALEIPTINGVYYGKSDTISGITLIVNIIDSVGHVGQAIARNVSIKRNVPELFTSKTVYDGDILPEKTSNISKIINDTLEVYLEAKTPSLTPSVTLSLGYNGIEGETITLTNTKPYAVTQYISISSHVVLGNRNLTAYNGGDQITLYVKDEEAGTTKGFGYIRYNGDRYDIDGLPDCSESFHIQQLSADTNKRIKLHIDSKDQLSANVQQTDKVENVSLYFIYYEGSEDETELYYQSEQKFTILPTWCELDGPRNTQGGIEFVVNNYNKFKKFEEDPGPYQFVITKDNWASQVQLVNSEGTKTDLTDTDAKNYKLTYEINNDTSGGAGSATIDEFGNIVTSEDFDVATGTITINLYMKVSGANNKWDVESDRKLGSLRISLQGEISPADVNIDNLYGTTVTGQPECPREFAYEMGSVVNFKDLLDPYIKKKEASGGQMDNNTHYHIVDIIKDGGDHNYYIGNNIDKWTFEYAGTYVLTIRITGYNTQGGTGFSTSRIIRGLILNFYIYDTSESSPTYVYLAKDESFSYGSNCYDISEDGALVSKPSETFDQSGRFERAFIKKTGTTFEYARYVFYVYDGQETYDVAKTRNGSWNLTNLNSKFDKPVSAYYTFVEDASLTDGTLNGDITLVAAYAETTGGTASYLVRFNDVAHTYKLIHVNFLIVDSIGTTYSGYMTKDRENPLTEQIKSYFTSRGIAIAEDFTIYAYEANGNGILKSFEEPDNIVGSTFQSSYVVVNNGQSTRLNVTFFPYEEVLNVTCEAEQSIAWPLSRLNETILAELGSETGTSVRYYKADGTTLSEIIVVSTEDLNTEMHDTFFVSVGDRYYLVNVTLTRAE